MMISNKKAFEIYLILRSVVLIGLIVVSGVLISTIVFKLDLYDTVASTVGNSTLLICTWLSCVLIIIDGRIKPAYVELSVCDSQIVIRTYSPHLSKWRIQFFLMGYKSRIRELLVSREEFNDYALHFGQLGVKKELKLQKINTTGIYESASINISLLSAGEYTKLILAVDRLRTKFSLN